MNFDLLLEQVLFENELVLIAEQAQAIANKLENLSDEEWDGIEVNEVNIGKLWDSLVMNSGEISFNGDIDFNASLDKYNGY